MLSPGGSRGTVFINASVFWGEGLDFVSNAILAIRDGKILRIQDLDESQESITKLQAEFFPDGDALIVDLSGHVIFPCLIDAAILYIGNTHILDPAGNKSPLHNGAGEESLKRYLRESIRENLSYGCILSLVLSDGDLSELASSCIKVIKLQDGKCTAGDASYTVQSLSGDFKVEKGGMTYTLSRNEYSLTPITVTGNVSYCWRNLKHVLKTKVQCKGLQSTSSLKDTLKSASITPAMMLGIKDLVSMEEGSAANFQLLKLPRKYDDEYLILKSILTDNIGITLVRDGLVNKPAFGFPESAAFFLSESVLPLPKTFNTVEEAIESIRKGHFVIVVDSESRENEGDLIIAAEDMTVSKMAFMIRNTSGVICVSVDPKILDALNLTPMIEKSTDMFNTAFAISCDFVHNTKSGISAHDRTLTVRALADKNSKPEDFSRPGHIFPLRPKVGGIIERAGHTESAWELCKSAGKRHAGVLGEISLPDGSIANHTSCLELAYIWNIRIITTRDLIKYRGEHPN